MYVQQARKQVRFEPKFILGVMGLLLLIAVPLVGKLIGQINPISTAASLSGFQPLPFQIVPNQGQLDDNAVFRAIGSGSVLSFTPTGVEFRLPGSETTFKLQYLGSNDTAPLVGADQLAGPVNYIQGNDPSNWFTNVPAFASLQYQQLYPGISLTFEGVEGSLKATYQVAPGADPNLIRWQYNGASSALVEPSSGDLLVTLPDQTQLIEQAPIAWQESNGTKSPVPVAYAVAATGEIGFEIGAYNPALPLTIDPVFVYETTLDLGGLESGNDIAVDGDGNVYVVTVTWNSGIYNLAVLKFSPDGDPLYTSYLGASGFNYSTGIAVNAAGDAYITGWTSSSDFPLVNPLQSELGGSSDAFITRFSSSDGTITYSTFLGGVLPDYGRDIEINSLGEIVVGGHTSSINFPTTPDAYQPDLSLFACFCDDAFITRISEDGSTIIYSTYYGGTRDDQVYGLELDADDNYYITGRTLSEDLPLVNPSQAAFGGGETDGYAAKLSADGSTLLFGTYFGGSDTDYGLRIAPGGSGNAYVTGVTRSLNFPTTAGSVQPFYGGGALDCGSPGFDQRNCEDAFVSAIPANGGAFLYSTYIGGSKEDEGRDIVVDDLGRAIAIIFGGSEDFPDADGSGNDIVVVKLTADGSAKLFQVDTWSPVANTSAGIALGVDGGIYITSGQNVPSDIYIAKLTENTVHVSQIRIRGRLGDATHRIKALVEVVDQDGNPVPGADVTVEITDPAAQVSTKTGTTNLLGRVKFNDRSNAEGVWEVCVVDIVSDSFAYDPNQNIVTCKTLSLP